MSYTKLFQSIVTSSIWTQDDQTRIVWITMLALANQHGEVSASIPGLARVSGVTVEATQKAIASFLAPDEFSRTKAADGRRIEAIEGGWLVLNHAKYRAMATDDDRKQKAADRKARQREREDAERHAPVTLPSRHVTPCHASVTPESRQNSQAEAEAYIHNTQEENGKAKPSLETIKLQCAKIGLPTEEAEKFLNYQEARGWTIGKSKIKSWTAALNIWKSNWRPSPPRAATSPTASNGRPKWAVIKDLEAELTELEGRLPCYFDRDADPVGAARIKEIQASLKTLKAERAENE